MTITRKIEGVGTIEIELTEYGISAQEFEDLKPIILEAAESIIEDYKKEKRE